MKQVKETIMSDKIANQDIENIAKNVKSSEEAMEIIKEMEKNIKVISTVFYGFSTNKLKYLKDFS